MGGRVTWHLSYCLFYSLTHRGFLWLSKKLQVSLIFVYFSYLIVMHVGKICEEQKVLLSRAAEMTRCKLWSFTVSAQLDSHAGLEPHFLQILPA